MMLSEANERLKTVQITEEQLWGINSLYLLLDLDKDDFCKIVDIVGIDKLLSKQAHYERIDRAERELSEKEQYMNAIIRKQEMEQEREQIERTIKKYEENYAVGWQKWQG